MTTLLHNTWPKCVAKCDKMCLCLVTFSANLLKCAFKYTDYNQILFRFGHICELYIKNYCRTTHNWAKKIPEQHDHFILLWFHEIHNWCWHFFFLKSRSFKILAYCLVCNKRASVYFILLLSFLWPQFIWKQVFLKEDVFLTYQILP